MTKKTNNAKELLEMFYSNMEEVFDDQITWYKKNSNTEEKEEYLSYIIWLREEIKNELNIKNTDEIIKEANKSVKH
tara:strand:- start:101 stop:328 length:228 start_codon:yes stop_codon:yes gene_type:complete